MTLQVEIDDEQQSILPRTHYTLTVTYDGTTPSRHDVKTKAHLHINDDKDKLIIRNFPSKQRGNQFTVQARQYHDEDAMELLEHEAMLDKNTAANAEDDDEEADAEESES